MAVSRFRLTNNNPTTTAESAAPTPGRPPLFGTSAEKGGDPEVFAEVEDIIADRTKLPAAIAPPTSVEARLKFLRDQGVTIGNVARAGLPPNAPDVIALKVQELEAAQEKKD